MAAYVVGWPVSKTADLPQHGPARMRDGRISLGCILSWQSFAEPADPCADLRRPSTRPSGFTGAPRKDTAIVCTNPITGTPGAAAPATANLGTLVSEPRISDSATLVPARSRRGATGAAC